MSYKFVSLAKRDFEQVRFTKTGIFNTKKTTNLKTTVPSTVRFPYHSPLFKRENQILKRVFDFVFSLMVIVLLLWWLVPLVGLLIKLDSPGPIFFTQLRSGIDNKPFLCFKFRSLRVNDAAHTKQVTAGDNRITKVGAILRKSNFDELPQFINVLMGHMSVVGPRPHMLRHTEEYAATLNYFMMRHTIKPGVTGLAQINGYRGEIKNIADISKRVDMDIRYIKSWSFSLDIRIIISTMFTAFGKKNNAL